MIQRLKSIVFIIYIGLLNACSTTTTDKNSAYEGPMIEATNIETILSEAAVISKHIIAKKLLEYKNGNFVYPEGIYVTLYQDGKKFSTLQADTAFFYTKKNIYKATGNVKVENFEQKQILYSDELYWDIKKKKIFTDKYIKIQTNEEFLTGTGLIAKENFTSYNILNPSGTLQITQ